VKITGLDGKQYSWNPTSSCGVSRETSSYHTKARELLKKLFQSERILEEVSLIGTKPVLFADFYLPLRSMIVEVHGEQHYKMTPMFHATQNDFVQGRKRDVQKKEWCRINGLSYIELPFSETESEWRDRITNFTNFSE
jgi:hypothetical protein